MVGQMVAEMALKSAGAKAVLMVPLMDWWKVEKMAGGKVERKAFLMGDLTVVWTASTRGLETV